MTTSKRFEMDLTSGNMLPEVIRYAAPLILSGFLQLFYNAADMIVVGRFAGAQSLAAVGSNSSLVNLVINMFIGISMGASVVVARQYGAGDRKAVSDTTHTAMLISLITGIVTAIFGVIYARPMLILMGSPEDVIDLAVLYLKIYFSGVPFLLIYNFGAALLRAVGDTIRPLRFLMISGLVNLVLNLLLVVVFHLDVAGVAIATVVSEAVSAVMVLQVLLQSDGVLHLELRKLALKKRPLRDILQIGIPAGIQNSLFSFSNVLIQSSINSFGSVVMAANTASSSLEGFVYTCMNGISQADMTFAGQNIGAGKYNRVRKTLRLCTITVAVVGLGVGLVFLALGPVLLKFYNTDPEVINFGLVRLRIICPTYFLCGMMEVAGFHLRGMGHSIKPMIISLTGACLLRILWIITIFAAYRTLTVLYISYPISWGLTVTAHLLCNVLIMRKMPRTGD